jgi:hypothetical protein
MADRYWVGGGGTWDSSSTTHWADASDTNDDGVGGASVPGTGDNVFFDAHSGLSAFTCTISGTVNCADITINNAYITFTSSSAALNCYGNIVITDCVSPPSNLLTWRPPSGTTKTISSTKGLRWTTVIINGEGTVQLASNLTFSTSNALTLTAGTFDPSTYGIDFGGNTTGSLSGAFTLYNLTINRSSGKTGAFVLYSNITVSNSLTLSGNSKINRAIVRSDTPGVARTITCNGSITCTGGVDFRDITGAGSASWDLSAAADYTGICGGVSGITGTTADTMYFHKHSGNDSWSTVGNWFLSSYGEGGEGRVPLPQDDVVFDANSFLAASMALTLDMPRMGRNITFAGDGSGAVVNSPALTQTIDNEIYGSLTLVSGMTRSGNFHFDFRNGKDITTSTLTTSGISLYHILVNMPGATLQLGDDLTCSAVDNAINFAYGTFDANDHNLTSAYSFYTSVAGTTIYMGNRTWKITGANGNNFNFNTNKPTNVYCEGSTIEINGSAYTYANAFGGFTYNNLIFNGAGSAAMTISGSNTFNNIFIDASLAPKTIKLTNSSTQTVNSITRDCNPRNKITIRNETGTTKGILRNGSGGCIVLPDYMDIDYVSFTSTNTLAAKWAYSGENNTKGRNNSGIIDYCGWVEPQLYPSFGMASLATAYTLTIDAGSITVGGQTVSLKRGTKISIDAGEITLAGQVVGLKAARKVTIDGGSVTIAGQTLSLLRGYKLVVGPGYSLTTSQPGENNDIIISASEPGYSLEATEDTLILRKNGEIIATEEIMGSESALDILQIVNHDTDFNRHISGVYAPGNTGLGDFGILVESSLSTRSDAILLAGEAAALKYGRKLSPDLGSIELSGRTVGLYRDSKISLDSGSIILDGVDTALKFGRKLSLDPGSIGLDGKTVGLRRDGKISLASGSITLDGKDVTLSYFTDKRILISAGAIAIAGQNVALMKDSKLSAESGALSISGADLRLLLGRKLSSEPGSIALDGKTIGLLRGYVLTVGTGAYVIVGTGVALTWSGLRYYIEVVELDSGITTLVNLDSSINGLNELDSGI